MPDKIKKMWIDAEAKVVSFHEIETGDIFEAEESEFWRKIDSLTEMFYRIQ